MAPEGRPTDEATPRHLDDLEPGGLMAISPRLLDLMFPRPDTSGMNPEQAEAAWVERDARINAFIVARAGPFPEGHPGIRTVRPKPGPPEVPAT